MTTNDGATKGGVHNPNTTPGEALPTGGKPLFDLGQVVVTAHAADVLHPEDVPTALRRHQHGDWGHVCPVDRRENDRALAEGQRIFSAHRDRNSTKFWIIVRRDRRSSIAASGGIESKELDRSTVLPNAERLKGQQHGGKAGADAKALRSAPRETCVTG